MLRYEVAVDDLLINGHPVNELFTADFVAYRRFDELVEKYPYNTVRLHRIDKVEIKAIVGRERIPAKCPRGHSGQRDGQNILMRGTGRGIWNCGVCGEIWEERGQ